MPDQIQARQAAVKFIDSSAGPNRLMAIVNFGGSLQISQNFTGRYRATETGGERRQSSRWSATIRRSAPGEADACPGSARPRSMECGPRCWRCAAWRRELGDVPGRKTLVLFSAGFPLNPEMRSEVTAVIDACNKSNVAIYPDRCARADRTVAAFAPGRGALLTPGAMRDAGLALAGNSGAADRGLSSRVAGAAARRPAGGGAGGRRWRAGEAAAAGGGGGAAEAVVASSEAGEPRAGPATPAEAAAAAAVWRRRRRHGRPRRGSFRHAAASATAIRMPEAAEAGTFRSGNPNDPFNRVGLPPRQVILPQIPESATTNQEVLYMLAQGTGGFVISQYQRPAGRAAEDQQGTERILPAGLYAARFGRRELPHH